METTLESFGKGISLKLQLSRVLASAASALLVGAVGATPAFSASITFGLDTEFSGAANPVGATPWATAAFDDSFGGPNTVRLTMSTPNLTGGSSGEFLSGFYFNFDPGLDAALLSFSVVNNGDSVPNSISAQNDTYMADGDGFFDILFDFPPPPGTAAAKFTGGETVIYDLTYTSAISASSFNFFSVMGGGNGSYQAAAHIQNIGAGDSGWVGPVPEPATGLMLGIGLAGMAWQGRRRRPL